MTLNTNKVSEAYSGRDIASLSDRPNQDGLTAAQLKARFDNLIKNLIPKHNSLIDALVLLLEAGSETNGHKHNMDNIVDGVTNRLFTEVLRLKLATIAENAEVNQNAFSSIKVGATTGNASSKTATFEIVAGLNIVASIDPLTNQITLSTTGDIATQAIQSVIDDIGNYFTSLNVNGALQEIGLALTNKVDKLFATNLVTNGDFSNGTTGWSNLNTSSSIINTRLYNDGLNASIKQVFQAIQATPTTHIFYIRCSYELISGSFGLGSKGDSIDNDVTTVGVGVFSKTISGGIEANNNLIVNFAISTKCYVDNILTINLTTLFGAGNEPTKEQMDAMLSYFPNSWFNGTVDLLPLLNVVKQLGLKVDKVTGKGLSTEDYTSAEKTKLSGIAVNANNYTHPTNHAPSIITQDANNRFVTDAEKSTWNGKLGVVTHDTSLTGDGTVGSPLSVVNNLGWNLINATLTYASADGPTFVANTSIDLTSIISEGMKIKLTQTTVKYFIVTAITSTTITLYGGTDYTLAIASITLPYFSSMKAPFGFPLNPDKWSVTVTDITLRSQIPVGATVYNIGGVNIVIPIGVWNVSFSVLAQIGSAAATSGPKYMTVSLSTTTTNNDTATSAGLAGGDFKFTRSFVQKNMLFTLTNKTTYYFNSANNGADGHELFNLNNEVALILKAVCAYL